MRRSTVAYEQKFWGRTWRRDQLYQGRHTGEWTTFELHGPSGDAVADL